MISKTKKMLEIERVFGQSIEFLLQDFYIEKQMTLQQVAEYLKVTNRTIFNWLQKCNIPTRSWVNKTFIRKSYAGKANPNYGRVYDEKLREKISLATKENMRKSNASIKISQVAKRRTGNKNSFYGKHHNALTKQKISKANKGRPAWNKGMVGEGYYKYFGGRENFIRNILKGLNKRPTSFEQKIINLCSEFNLPYKYVGDGSVIICFRNPDFINTNGEKKLIETYFTKWHPPDYEKQRANIFAKYGYKTIFFNEGDLLDKSWKPKCLNKLR